MDDATELTYRRQKSSTMGVELNDEEGSFRA